MTVCRAKKTHVFREERSAHYSFRFAENSHAPSCVRFAERDVCAFTCELAMQLRIVLPVRLGDGSNLLPRHRGVDLLRRARGVLGGRVRSRDISSAGAASWVQQLLLSVVL